MEVKKTQSRKDLYQIEAPEFMKMILGSLSWLKQYQSLIDSLNVFPVPDGDTGTNMYLTMRDGVEEIKGRNIKSCDKLAQNLATGVLMGARGNSGVILSQLFRGFANGVKGHKTIDARVMATGLKAAADRAYQAVMKPVEGTILTVAREAGNAASKAVQNGIDDIIKLLEITIEAANESLRRTPELLPALKEANVVDAGGQGYVIIWEGALRALKGDMVEEAEIPVSLEKQQAISVEEAEDKAIEFQYCTEFLIKGRNLPVDRIRKDLVKYGNSLLVVGSPEVTKVHVHSNNPGLVLEYCLKYGSLSKIKIDNLVEQSQEKKAREQNDTPVSEETHSKEVGIVSVVTGDGLKEIFQSLGVDEVVEGGQSMNPSTQDIASAVEKVNAQTAIILPNNKNIIFSVEQVREIVDKEVIVIPSKTIPQGLAALMAFNPGLNKEEITRGMKEELQMVKTGEITYAVRDSKYNNQEITEGDILGLLEGEINVVDKDVAKAAFQLIQKMVDEDNFLITIFYGEDIDEREAEELGERVRKAFPDCDVEVYRGGQPLYYYIFSVE